jgi:hypothetical protein
MSADKFPRKDFMTRAQREAIGRAPRRHDLCKKLLEGQGLAPVGRPGKTRQDHARRFGGAA